MLSQSQTWSVYWSDIVSIGSVIVRLISIMISYCQTWSVYWSIIVRHSQYNGQLLSDIVVINNAQSKSHVVSIMVRHSQYRVCYYQTYQYNDQALSDKVSIKSFFVIHSQYNGQLKSDIVSIMLSFCKI